MLNWQEALLATACHDTGQNQFDVHLECMHFVHDVLYSPPDHLAPQMLG